MLALIEFEDDKIISITSAMDVILVDQGDYAGMSLVSTIPFGIDQTFTVNKEDILFTVEPNEFLSAIYLTRAEEAIDSLLDHVEKVEQKKKLRDKSLN
jgi:hypothetical protein